MKGKKSFEGAWCGGDGGGGGGDGGGGGRGWC